MFQLLDTSWHNMDVKQHGTIFICKVESESGETKEDSAQYLRKMQEKEKCIKHISFIILSWTEEERAGIILSSYVLILQLVLDQ